VHYSSPRFRRDAKDELGKITNTFNTLISALIKARYHDAKELEKKLAAATQQAHEAQRKYDLLRVETDKVAEASRQALLSKQGELDRILALYQRSLGQ
jgi:F0F1-type ATP synthase membrane subunit b/b'